MLMRGGQSVALTVWGGELLADMVPLAAWMDEVHGLTPDDSASHAGALAAMQARLHALDSSPSARVLASVKARADQSFVGFVRERSAATRQYLLDLPWTADLQAAFEAESQASLAAQTAIEQADSLPFEMYRQIYVSADRLGEHLPSPP
jgi:glutamate--cysteine ligase